MKPEKQQGKGRSCLHQKKGVTKRDNVVMSKINSNRMKHDEASQEYL